MVAPEAAAVLRACDGRRSLTSLKKISSDAEEIVETANRSGILTWNRIPKYFIGSKKRRRWLMLSPHQDDIAVSIGGLILKSKGTAEVHILTLASRSIFSVLPMLSGSSSRTSKIRNLEDDIYAMSLGAKIHRGNLREQLLIAQTSARHTKKEAMKKLWLPPSPQKVARFQKVIESYIRKLKPNVLFVPLGVGDHIEHTTTNLAVLRILRKNPRMLNNVEIVFYEELPYSQRYPRAITQRLKHLEKQGIQARPRFFNITKELEEKVRGIRIYKSQAYKNFIEAAVKHSRKLKKNGHYERLWELVKS